MSLKSKTLLHLKKEKLLQNVIKKNAGFIFTPFENKALL